MLSVSSSLVTVVQHKRPAFNCITIIAIYCVIEGSGLPTKIETCIHSFYY